MRKEKTNEEMLDEMIKGIKGADDGQCGGVTKGQFKTGALSFTREDLNQVV